MALSGIFLTSHASNLFCRLSSYSQLFVSYFLQQCRANEYERNELCKNIKENKIHKKDTECILYISPLTSL